MSARRFAALLLLVAGLAFVGRAAYVIAVTNGEVAIFDEIYYQRLAEGLADGEGFTIPPAFGNPRLDDAERPPLTALALTPAAWLTGDSELAMRLTVALAGTGVVVVVGLIGRELAGNRVGLIAAILAAVYPNLLANDGLLMSETFATLGTAATILWTYRLARDPTWTNAGLAGVACGVAMLSRGELVLLVPALVLPVALTIKGVSRRRRIRLAGLGVAAASVVVAPWIAYNLARFDDPVLLSHGDGGVLLGANCDETYSGPRIGSWYGFCAPFTDPARVEDQSTVASARRDRALDYVGDHLGRVPVVAAARVGRVWSVYRPFQGSGISDGEERPGWVSRTGWAMLWLLVVPAVAGAIELRRRRVTLVPLIAPIAIVTVVAALFYGAVRFRAPAEVSLVVLAAVGVDYVAVSAWRGAAPYPRAS